MRLVLVVVLIFAAAGLPPAGGHAPDNLPAHEGAAQASPLEAFAPYIGRWGFTDTFLAENEWARDFDAEVYEWGARRNLVRLRETAHRQTRDRVVFEGFAYWHPTANDLRFSGYNVQERFYFEGAYTVLEPDRMVREYTVHYPPGYQHGALPDGPATIREYRGERRLIHPDTMQITTRMKLDGAWVPWPNAEAPPFRVVRVPAG